jgi:hypothetical protein
MDGSPHGGKIRAALEELLNWPPIARSPQLAKFLTYIVTATLEGQDAQIKAYSIAVDVFGRPASFDPQSDPIVRVQARRLRALLDQYYAEGNGSAGVRIQLPVGRYVPEFSSPDLLPEDEGPAEDAVRQPETEPTAGRRPGRMAQALFAGLAMLAIGLGLLAFSQRAGGEVAGLPPEEPVLIVGQFSNLTDASGLDSFGSQLSAAIRASLAPFEDIRTMPTDPTPGTTSMPPGTYLLSGVVHTVASGIEITAMLSNGASKTLWTATFARPMPQSGEIGAVSTAARTIARELAPFRGPLHAAGRTWLDEQPRPLSRVNTYVCLIAYYRAGKRLLDSDRRCAGLQRAAAQGATVECADPCHIRVAGDAGHRRDGRSGPFPHDAARRTTGHGTAGRRPRAGQQHCP